MKTKRTTLTHAMLALAAMMLAACGDDAPGGGGDGGVGPEGEASYVVVAQDSAAGVSYLVQVPELGAAASSSLTGIEVPGAAVGVSFGNDAYLYVGHSEGPEIVRYEVTERGIVEDTRITLGVEGTAAIGGYQSNLLLVDETKAYYVDTSNSQIVIWNPRDMVVTGTIEHDPINESGVRTGISGFPIAVDAKFFIGLGWLDATTLDVVRGAAVLVIDTATDTATVVRDPAERCGYTFSVVEGTDGIYVGTEAYGAAQHALSEATAAPCMVRLDPETLEFAPDYEVDLGALVGGAPAGTLVPGPEAGTAYLRALDEEALGMTLEEWKTGGEGGGPVGNGRVLSSRAAWTWHELALGDEPVATALEHAPTSGATLRIDAGDRALIPEFDAANGATYLRDFTGHVYGEVALEAQGHVRSVVRVVRKP